MGLSGLMRVKDDALTLEASIDSCIDGLDELIITYNDCTDNSAEIKKKAIFVSLNILLFVTNI